MSSMPRFSTTDAEYLMRHKELQLVSSSMEQVEAAMQRIEAAAVEYARALQGAADVFAVFAGVNRAERPSEYATVQRLGTDLKALQKSKPLTSLKSGMLKNGRQFTSSVRQPIQSAQELATKCEQPLKRYVECREKVHKARLKAMPSHSKGTKNASSTSSLFSCRSSAATGEKRSVRATLDRRHPSGLTEGELRAAEAQLRGQKWYAQMAEQLAASQKILEKGNCLFQHEMATVARSCGTGAIRSVDVMLKLNIEFMEHCTTVLRGAWGQFSLGREDHARRQRAASSRFDQLTANRKLAGDASPHFVEGTVIETGGAVSQLDFGPRHSSPGWPYDAGSPVDHPIGDAAAAGARHPGALSRHSTGSAPPHPSGAGSPVAQQPSAAAPDAASAAEVGAGNRGSPPWCAAASPPPPARKDKASKAGRSPSPDAHGDRPKAGRPRGKRHERDAASGAAPAPIASSDGTARDGH